MNLAAVPSEMGPSSRSTKIRLSTTAEHPLPPIGPRRDLRGHNQRLYSYRETSVPVAIHIQASHIMTKRPVPRAI